jgi:hypothetical protein
MKKITLMLFALVLTSHLMAQDFEGGDEFGPFRDDEKIEKVLLKQLDVISTAQTSANEQDQTLGFVADLLPTFQVQILSTPSRAVFQMTLGKKKAPLQFTLDNVGNFSVYSADLNGDGLPDYVIETVKGGDDTNTVQDEEADGPQGIGLVLLLSDHKSYKAYEIPGTDYLSWGFLKLKPGPDTQFLHHAQIRKSPFPDKPGKLCLFQLYQLLNIHGASVSLDTTDDPRFPKFVCRDLGTLRKNHKETKLLTPDDKKKLLGEHLVQIVQIPVKKISKKHKR